MQYYAYILHIVSRHARKPDARPPRVKKKRKKRGKKKGGGGGEAFRLVSNDFGFICAVVNNVNAYKRNVRYHSICLLQTHCHLSTIEELSVSGQVLRPMT